MGIPTLRSPKDDSPLIRLLNPFRQAMSAARAISPSRAHVTLARARGSAAQARITANEMHVAKLARIYVVNDHISELIEMRKRLRDSGLVKAWENGLIAGIPVLVSKGWQGRIKALIEATKSYDGLEAAIKIHVTDELFAYPYPCRLQTVLFHG